MMELVIDSVKKYCWSTLSIHFLHIIIHQIEFSDLPDNETTFKVQLFNARIIFSSIFEI